MMWRISMPSRHQDLRFRTAECPAVDQQRHYDRRDRQNPSWGGHQQRWCHSWELCANMDRSSEKYSMHTWAYMIKAILQEKYGALDIHNHRKPLSHSSLSPQVTTLSDNVLSPQVTTLSHNSFLPHHQVLHKRLIVMTSTWTFWRKSRANCISQRKWTFETVRFAMENAPLEDGWARSAVQQKRRLRSFSHRSRSGPVASMVLPRLLAIVVLGCFATMLANRICRRSCVQVLLVLCFAIQCLLLAVDLLHQSNYGNICALVFLCLYNLLVAQCGRKSRHEKEMSRAREGKRRRCATVKLRGRFSTRSGLHTSYRISICIYIYIGT